MYLFWIDIRQINFYLNYGLKQDVNVPISETMFLSEGK